MQTKIVICILLFGLLPTGFAQVPASPAPQATPGRIGLVFSSVGDDTFAINSADHRTPTQFLKQGDRIPRTEYVIIGYNPLPKPGRLSLEHRITHAKVQLELGKLTWLTR